MQTGSNSGLKAKTSKGIWDFLKRLFPAGSLGRRVFYQLRARYGRSIISLDRRPPLPIDRDLERFLDSVREREHPVVVVILASTELVESEGQRSTNLAFEFSQRGIPCVFGYWRWKSDTWALQNRLESGILQIPVDVLASWPEMLFRGINSEKKILLIEFPHPSFFKLVSEAHASGWIVIYDAVDDWEEFSRVGQAIWYEPDFERHLLNTADAITAVNKFLADHLLLSGAPKVAILPNGLSIGVEIVDQERQLERGEVTIGYFGYLAGAWFDWELLVKVATKQPSWKFYLIGYGGSPESVQLPENIVLLGKKPRTELASYAINWDVAIIPFKDERLARGADPIKIYEYLAMGLPVVVSGVYPPVGGEAFVQRVQGVEAFIGALEMAARNRHKDVEGRVHFAKTCAWYVRVDEFLNMVEVGAQRIGEKHALFGIGK